MGGEECVTYAFQKVNASDTFLFAGDSMSPGRFCSDHLKMGPMLERWTEYYLGWTLRHMMMNAFKGKSKLWSKMQDARAKQLAETEASSASGQGQVKIGEAAKKALPSANPVRRYVFIVCIASTLFLLLSYCATQE